MTKHTQDQLLAMTNEQLDEIVALAQGWSLRDDGIYSCSRYTFEYNYHPSTNKEQAWDLMVKCKINPWEAIETYAFTQLLDHVRARDIIRLDPLIAVTIATILHLQGSE